MRLRQAWWYRKGEDALILKGIKMVRNLLCLFSYGVHSLEQETIVAATDKLAYLK